MNRNMRVVVLDGFTENPGDLSWEWLSEFGETTIYARTPVCDTREIIARIGDAKLILTNKTPIGREVLDACSGLGFIGMLSTGYNVIDVEYARKKGVTVSNVPAYGTAAVSQFAIALLLEICHYIGHHSHAVHEGQWARKPDWCFWDYPLIELAGKTMGIIGFGRIGQATGKITKAMGMKVIAYDSLPTESGREICAYAPLDELLAQADVIALHCPLLLETTGIIRKETISKMKNGVIIINNSRGGLIVEQDLADALNAGKVYAAGVDVVSIEPISKDNPLLGAKNCFITPHISWAPIECRQRIMEITQANLRAYISGSPVNVVN